MKKSALAFALIWFGFFSPSLANAAEPCDGAFELSVQVESVDAIVSSRVGFQIAIARKGAAQATLLTNPKQVFKIDQESCQEWQHLYWPHVGRILGENKRKDRAAMPCRNLASVEYRLGSQRKSARVCLGDAREDGITAGFKSFFEGTEGVIEDGER